MSSNRKSYRNQRRIVPHGVYWQAEHNLISAMLQQALWDRQRTPNRNWDGRWGEARHWINSMSEEPFGFAWCCRQVDLDPGQVRSAIFEQWQLEGGPAAQTLPPPI